jgi:hypothetical protein
MEKIEFNKDYEKLPKNWDGSKALLLAHYQVNSLTVKRKLPALYAKDIKIRNKRSYAKIKHGLKIILFLIHKKTGIIFTTMRTFNRENKKKYFGREGEYYKLVRVY